MICTAVTRNGRLLSRVVSTRLVVAPSSSLGAALAPSQQRKDRHPGEVGRSRLASVRAYGKRPPQKKKSASKAVDRLLDELDSDDDVEEEEGRLAAATDSSPAGDEAVLADSPVARFVDNCQKHKRKKITGKLKGKSGHVQHITYLELREIMDFDSYWAGLGKEVEAMRNHFVKQLTVRSSTVLDNLPVPLEGDTFPLHEVASVSKKDPNRIIIDSSSFPQATKSIVEVIRDSGMNLNPQQEGTRIYVPIPKVTREHRERLAKGVKAKLNETKDNLRRVQNKFLSRLQDLEMKDGGPSKDSLFAASEVVRAAELHFSAEAEKMAEEKEKDVLGGGKVN